MKPPWASILKPPASTCEQRFLHSVPHFYLHRNPTNEILWPPFYVWENQGSERLRDFPKAIRWFQTEDRGSAVPVSVSEVLVPRKDRGLNPGLALMNCVAWSKFTHLRLRLCKWRWWHPFVVEKLKWDNRCRPNALSGMHKARSMFMGHSTNPRPSGSPILGILLRQRWLQCPN